MKYPFLLKCVLFFFAFSSCGIVTKTRYGNGYKLNIEFNKKEKIDYFEAKTAHKKEKNSPLILQDLGDNNDSNTYSIEVNNLKNEEISSIKEENKHISKVKNFIIDKKTKFLPNKKIVDKPKPEKKPFEKHVKIAAWLFYIGVVLALLTSHPIAGLLTLAGFILAIIGYKKIRRSNYELRGEGLAISIIALYLLALIIAIAILLLLILAFA